MEITTIIESIGGIPSVNDLLKFIVTALKENQFAQGGFIIGLLSAAFMLLRGWLLVPYYFLKKWARKLIFEQYIVKQDEDKLLYSFNNLQKHLNEYIWWNNTEYQGMSMEGLPEGRFVGRSPDIGFFSVSLTRTETEKLVRYSLIVVGIRGINRKIKLLQDKLRKEKDGDIVRIVTNGIHNYFSRSRIPFVSSLCHEPTLHKIRDKVEYLTNNIHKIEEKGFPARLGICLYGPPGTGKSSFVNGIVKETNAKLVINVSSKTTILDIHEGLKRESGIGIVVFDDIDLLLNNRIETENTEKRKIDLVDIMNFMSSPFTTGVIFLFTTNYLDRLDSALIRKGRIDLLLEVPPMSDEQFDTLQKENPLARLKREMSLSEMSEALLEVEMNSHEGHVNV